MGLDTPLMDPKPRPDADVTGLLQAWGNGNREAPDRLLAIVYQELRRRAAAHVRRERIGHTLQPTALVHEVYLLLLKQDRAAWENRAQFFGIAAQMMRRILVDRARARNAAKRSGRWARVPIDEALAQGQPRDVDVIDLHAALGELTAFDARKSQIAELRFFGGLSLDESAETLGDLDGHGRARMAGGAGVALRAADAVRAVTPERWRQITGIFHAARERDPAERDAFVAEACHSDPALRREVDAMLAGLAAAGGFGETPLFPSASRPGAAAPSALAPGSQLGPYEIRGLLGAGGMGQVYKAFDRRLHREIAIKVCAERFSEQFDREVRVIATLNHPNICTVHDVGPDYLVTELVEGETLRAWLVRAPPIERSLEVARQVLEALAAAHNAGIVHRDLKPENVMVRFDGYVKVLDFGLASRIPDAHDPRRDRKRAGADPRDRPVHVA